MAAPQQDTSAEDIARDLMNSIITHRLPPGTRLREEALARVYHVSRTKIRAALLMLTKDKLVRTIPDKGAFVSKPSAEEAKEIYNVRRILEAALAKEFVAKATPEDFKRLHAHIDAEHAALEKDSVQQRNVLLSDFHILLAEVVGNTVLTEMLRELSARSAVITMLYQSTMDAACSSHEHREFLDVAQRKNAELASALMVEHINHVEAALHFEHAPSTQQSDIVTALLS